MMSNGSVFTHNSVYVLLYRRAQQLDWTMTMHWLLKVLILFLALPSLTTGQKRRKKGQRDDNQVIVNEGKGKSFSFTGFVLYIHAHSFTDLHGVLMKSAKSTIIATSLSLKSNIISELLQSLVFEVLRSVGGSCPLIMFNVLCSIWRLFCQPFLVIWLLSGHEVRWKWVYAVKLIIRFEVYSSASCIQVEN